jgi:hypothetical protein
MILLAIGGGRILSGAILQVLLICLIPVLIAGIFLTPNWFWQILVIAAICFGGAILLVFLVMEDKNKNSSLSEMQDGEDKKLNLYKLYQDATNSSNPASTSEETSSSIMRCEKCGQPAPLKVCARCGHVNNRTH